MSKSNFIIDPNEFDDQSTTLCKSPKPKTISQMLKYINFYYENEVEIPQKQESEYMGMLSCIEDIINSPKEPEPWNWLSYLDKRSKEPEGSKEYIPIKLVRWKDLPKISPKGDKPTNDKIISPDILGAYRSWDAKEKKPIILLCPSKILKEANKLDMDAKLLCKKVIIHEFAHALMDPTNWKSETDFAPLQKINPQKKTSDARRIMEESLANMLTLQYFTEIAKKSETKKVKKFIENNQPSIYQFGVHQFKLNTSWKEWRDYKANKTPDFWSYWAGLFAGKKIVKSKQ